MRQIFKTYLFIMVLAISFQLSGSIVNAAVLDIPAGTTEGINYIDDNTVVLVLLAPNKTTADVTGSFNDWTNTEMNQTPDGEHFWIQIDGLTAGEEYIYQYIVDGSIRISDPFAEKILDPWNDEDIPADNYPGLIAWGTDEEKEKGLASVFQTAQDEYNWQVTDFQGPLQHQLIAYELLIRDFDEERSFQSVIDNIDYLKNLGINALELMPVNEFDGNLSWGYNPSHYFAVDKMYGPKEKLQELVDVCHQNGIAVIIDMVYNHTFNQSPLASLYWDGELNQPAADNPWYNETAPHTCVGWGNDFNHESEYTKEFFDRVNKFWIEEFKIDGFRYDFTKGLTQTYSDDENYVEEDGEWLNCGNHTDWSRINIIKRLVDKVWEVKDNAYIILEHWGRDKEENELVSYGNGMLTWRKVHYQYTELLKGEKLYEESMGGAQSDSRMIFMQSHDEERIPYDVNHHIDNDSEMKDRMELGAAFFYTIPGPKMLWMFEELACDYSIFTCEDGTVQYNDGCKLATKPFVREDYLNDPDRVDVYNTVAEILKLRKENDAFTMGYYEIDENGDGIADNGLGQVRQIRIKHDDMDIVIIGNFGRSSASINPWFTKQGTWYNYFNEAYPTYEYTGQTSYDLAGGQWELFTSVPIDDDKVLAPSGLSTTVSGSDVTLTWVDNSDNETGFQVERSTSSTGGFASIASNLPVNTQSYTDLSLADGKYYYRVRANGIPNPSDYSNVADAQVGEPQGVTVHFKNTSSWNPVKLYVFDWDTKQAIEGWTWSGKEMAQEKDSPWYVYTIQENVTPGIVFNNGSGEKTDDLTRTTDGWYDFSTQQWYNECPGDCPTDPLPVLTADPMGGVYENSVTVTLSATESGIITYSLDGSNPSLPYTAPIEIISTTRLRALASNDNGTSNDVDETYTITYPIPELSVSPTGQEFVGSIAVSLEATKDGEITYTIDGSDPKNGDSYTGELTFTDDTRLRAIAQNQNGYSDEIDEYYDKVESVCDTIYYYNSNNWSSVNIYMFNANGSGLSGWNWPGVPMTQIGTSKWYYYVNCEEGDVGIVFNDGSGNQESDQFQNSGWFYYGSWYTSCPGDCPGEQPDGITIMYNNNNTNWSNVSLYFWSVTPSGQTTSWPGVQMSDDDGDGWYTYTLEGAECANVIFSNNGNPQTDDLNICGDGYYDNGWVSAPAGVKSAEGMSTISSSTFNNMNPYPNPFNNELSISISEQDIDVNISVIDLNGRKVYSSTLNSNSGTINIQPEIPNGIYIMHIATKNYAYAYRIIKQ